jgi:CubicO group peptidase (beta-lactamase class C family)
VLLGLIAEAVMADTAEQYFRNTFLTPAGLSATVFPPAEPVNCNMPDAFDELSQYGLQNFPQWSNYVQPGELQQVPISLAGVASIAWTTGALVGKAEDIARWGEALYEAQVVSPAVRNQILASLDFQVTNGQAYGYGVFRDTYAGEHCVGHGGAAPGFRSVMVYDTLNNLAIGLMMNQGEGSPSRVANALRNEVLGLTDRDEQLGLQRGTAMSTAYPNPATEHISVDITALTARHLRLELLDMNGRLVRRALDEQLPAGQHTHLVDVSDMASGAYFLRLSGDDAYQVQKIVIQ